jgi:hypothetical protein
MNLVGFFAPPAKILPRKRIKTELFKNAPEGTVPTVSDGEFVNKKLFVEWLKHFTKYAKPTQDNPATLTVDTHFHTTV